MNDKDQEHLDAIIILYENKLKESISLQELKELLEILGNERKRLFDAEREAVFVTQKEATQKEYIVVGYLAALLDIEAWATKQVQAVSKK